MASTRPLGILNLGNSCFMNAALQLLGSSTLDFPAYLRSLSAQLHAWRLLYRAHRVIAAVDDISAVRNESPDAQLSRCLTSSMGRPPLSPRAVRFFLDLVRTLSLSTCTHQALTVCSFPPELLSDAFALTGLMADEDGAHAPRTDIFISHFLARQDPDLGSFFQALPPSSCGIAAPYPFATNRASATAPSLQSISRGKRSTFDISDKSSASVSLPHPPLRLKALNCIFTHGEQLVHHFLPALGNATKRQPPPHDDVVMVNQQSTTTTNRFFDWLASIGGTRASTASPSLDPSQPVDLQGAGLAFDDDELEAHTNWVPSSRDADSLHDLLLTEFESSEWLQYEATDAAEGSAPSLHDKSQQDSHEFLARLLEWLSQLSQYLLASAQRLHQQFAIVDVCAIASSAAAPPASVVIPRVCISSVAAAAASSSSSASTQQNLHQLAAAMIRPAPDSSVRPNPDSDLPSIHSQSRARVQCALRFLLHPYWLEQNASPPFIGAQGSELRCAMQHAPLVRCNDMPLLSLTIQPTHSRLADMVASHSKIQRLDDVICPTCSVASALDSAAAAALPPTNKVSLSGGGAKRSKRAERSAPTASTASAQDHVWALHDQEYSVRRGLCDNHRPLLAASRTNGPSLPQLHETSCDGTLPILFSAPRAHAAAAEIPLVRGAMSKQLHILRYPPMFIMHLLRTDFDGSKLHQNILVPLEWRVPPLLPKIVATTATIQRPAPAALNSESVSVARPVSIPIRSEQAASLSRLGDEVSLAPPAFDSSSSWQVIPRDPFQASTLPENALSARLRYSLRAVVEHIGGSSSGHYVCFRQFDSRWYRMDDGRVSEVDAARVLGAEAYMLCYERC